MDRHGWMLNIADTDPVQPPVLVGVGPHLAESCPSAAVAEEKEEWSRF